MEIFQTIWTALTTPNETLTKILSIPLGFLEAFISMLFFTTVLNIQANKKQKIKYVLYLGVLTNLFSFVIPNSFIVFLLNTILWPTLVILILKTSILKGILSEVFTLILSLCLELFVTKFFYMIFKFDYNLIVSIPFLRCSLALLIFYITLISIIGLLAYFALSIYSILNISKLEITSRDLKQSQLYNKTLTVLHDNIRAFKHDFHNIVHALGGYIDTEDIEGLKKYYQQLLNDCQCTNNLTGLSPSTINNPAIYNVLASKYHKADELGIKINLEVFLDLNEIESHMKIYEFARILGILFDNAIEATKECDKKLINLTIRKDLNKNRLLLIVENTYKNKDVDTEKIYEKGFSTKPGNSGLGLWKVRQILIRNNNLNLFTTKIDEYFKQQLEIY